MAVLTGARFRRFRRFFAMLIVCAAAAYFHSLFMAPPNIRAVAGFTLQTAAASPPKPQRGLYDEAYLLDAAAIFSSLKGVQRAGYEKIQGDDRQHALPLITGDGFRHMSDVFIELDNTIAEGVAEDFESAGWCAGLGADLNLTSNEALVLFVAAEASPKVFAAACIEKITRPFVLVTHNGDESFPGDASALLDLPLLVHWFTQNCDRAHAKLTCVPIGLENRKWGPPREKGHHGSMPELMMGMLALFAPREPAAGVVTRALVTRTMQQTTEQSVPPIEHTWAYFDRGTHAKVRDPLWTFILKAHEAAQPHLLWIRIAGAGGRGNVLAHELYRFMLTLAALICPRGNGLDTHRVWESLYLGRTTIVASGTLDPLFKDLPVLILDDWRQIFETGSEELVINTTQAFAARALHGPPFAVEKLFMMHWLCLVGKAARRETEYCGVDAIRNTLSGESARQRQRRKLAM